MQKQSKNWPGVQYPLKCWFYIAIFQYWSINSVVSRIRKLPCNVYRILIPWKALNGLYTPNNCLISLRSTKQLKLSILSKETNTLARVGLELTVQWSGVLCFSSGPHALSMILHLLMVRFSFCVYEAKHDSHLPWPWVGGDRRVYFKIRSGRSLLVIAMTSSHSLIMLRHLKDCCCCCWGLQIRLPFHWRARERLAGEWMWGKSSIWFFLNLYLSMSSRIQDEFVQRFYQKKYRNLNFNCSHAIMPSPFIKMKC